MRRMRYALLLVGLLLALPTAANASTQFYNEGTPIPPGETVEVQSTSVRLNVVLKLPKQAAIKIPCAAKGGQAFWNGLELGFDETRSISFACTEAAVTPILPWTSTLLEGPLPLHDRWEGVALELTYHGASYGVFTGELDAKLGDVDPEIEPKDELDNNLTFKGGARLPHLSGANGAMVWLTGFYRLGTKTTGIGDKPS